MSIDTTLAEFYTLQNYLMMLMDFVTEKNVLKVFGLDDYDEKYIRTSKDEENFFVQYLIPNYETETYRVYGAQLNYGTFEISTTHGPIERFSNLKKHNNIKNIDSELERTLAKDLFPENFF
jgi:hypothetical protein